MNQYNQRTLNNEEDYTDESSADVDTHFGPIQRRELEKSKFRKKIEVFKFYVIYEMTQIGSALKGLVKRLRE